MWNVKHSSKHENELRAKKRVHSQISIWFFFSFRRWNDISLNLICNKFKTNKKKNSTHSLPIARAQYWLYLPSTISCMSNKPCQNVHPSSCTNNPERILNHFNFDVKNVTSFPYTMRREWRKKRGKQKSKRIEWRPESAIGDYSIWIHWGWMCWNNWCKSVEHCKP